METRRVSPNEVQVDKLIYTFADSGVANGPVPPVRALSSAARKNRLPQPKARRSWRNHEGNRSGAPGGKLWPQRRRQSGTCIRSGNAAQIVACLSPLRPVDTSKGGHGSSVHFWHESFAYKNLCRAACRFWGVLPLKRHEDGSTMIFGGALCDLTEVNSSRSVL